MTPVKQLARLSFVVAPGMSLDEVRERLLNSTLRFTGGNKTQAARLLGVDPKSVYRWTRDDQPESPNERFDSQVFA